jgi:cytochrome c551/c552
MKTQLLSILLIAFILGSCNDSSLIVENHHKDSIKKAQESIAIIEKPIVVKDPESSIYKGENLMRQSDCFSCHSVDEKIIGPSFTQISNRYDANKDKISYLINKVMNGGSGAWGQIPMQPHHQLNQGDVKEMVLYILSFSENK